MKIVGALVCLGLVVVVARGASSLSQQEAKRTNICDAFSGEIVTQGNVSQVSAYGFTLVNDGCKLEVSSEERVSPGDLLEVEGNMIGKSSLSASSIKHTVEIANDRVPVGGKKVDACIDLNDLRRNGAYQVIQVEEGLIYTTERLEEGKCYQLYLDTDGEVISTLEKE